MSNQKRLVLVTGGSYFIFPSWFLDVNANILATANGGIGFEVVTQLLAEGSFHVLLGARLEEKGQAALVDLRSRNLPGTVELLQLDVADESSIATAAKLVEEKHGRYVVGSFYQ